MSNRSKHRRLRRLALGLALASIAFASCVSVAAAMRSEAGDGQAALPRGEHQPIDWRTVEVIPYLSHGMFTPTNVKAAAIGPTQDPFLTDVYVRPGESLGGPDGGPKPERNHGSEEDLSVDAESDDIGGGFAQECRQLRLSGDPQDMVICMDYSALAGSDRD